MSAEQRRQDAVLRWYAAVRRDLPWRRTRDPYRLLVAEVMLQQTQVARVVPFYAAWLERFPDERALAEATAADALRAWSGLGHNRRALALRDAARVVVADGWPRTEAGLRALPGVGPYTAAAIVSFGFGTHAAAVDTNVRRVIARWDGEARTPAALAARAGALLPAGRAADWNQAMMELGATVCGARVARCEACPAAPWCASRDRVAVPARRARRAAPRFEGGDRWARGRIVAALLAAAPLPDLGPERLERALDGLARDGLVVRDRGGVRLPETGRRVP